MQPRRRGAWLPAAAAAAAAAAPRRGATLSVASVFGDGMVLQHGARAAVYGTSTPGDTVSVRVSDAAGGATATASATGQWKALLAPRPPGGNVSVTISSKGGGEVALAGVTFGDVWFCSGQSNMELGLKFTLSKNDSVSALREGKYAGIRLFHFDHNPTRGPVYVTNGSVVAGWRTAAAAVADDSFDNFAAACYYFGESLTDRMGGDAVPIGLIESAYGGTMIESWADPQRQLACSNITCTANQSQHFTRATEDACLAAATDADLRTPFDWGALSAGQAAKGAGANGMLYNGMVLPFVNMTLKGWLWYQGENNLAFHAGNVLAGAGYACMLPLLIRNWREVWAAEPGTTDADAPFGIVTLADSSDEGWGCNVPQMHWAETGNVGHAPNQYLPGTFLAAAHDLADPWDDNCWAPPSCCIDTGGPVNASCGPHRGWLVQGHGSHAGEPATPTMGLTIHPRVKRPVGRRLAQAAWALAYGHDDEAWTGPVVSGCALLAADGGARRLRVSFNSSLLKGDRVDVSSYSKEEKASVTWVLMSGAGTTIPDDAWENYVYANRQAWWGDDTDWVNVDIEADSANTVSVLLPPEGEVLAVKYGHQSPKGSPQNGHDKMCCGDRDFRKDPCPPESCPISSSAARLPAMPFMARVVGGKCQCVKPQVCDE